MDSEKRYGGWGQEGQKREMREYQYREGYARSHEGKGVEWDGSNNVEHMWEQVKRAMLNSAREVCGSVRVGRKTPKSMQWNDEIKAAVIRKEAAWKGVLAASDEETKERCMEAYREEKRKAKRCIIQRKKESK